MTDFKFLREFIESDYLIEKVGTEQNYFINGPFAQSEVVNKNGRIYPRAVLESQINFYQTMIKDARSVGELNHPESPNINPERISHLITSLKMEGNDAIGKAKILHKLPMGQIARGLLESGVRLGVSTRGLGSLKERNGKKYVCEDFQLAAVDIVFDPSAPKAFMESIIEGASWTKDSKLGWVPQYREEIVKPTLANKGRCLDEEVAAELFEKFMKGL